MEAFVAMKFMFCLDGSPLSESAIPFCKALTEAAQAEVQLVYVIGRDHGNTGEATGHGRSGVWKCGERSHEQRRRPGIDGAPVASAGPGKSPHWFVRLHFGRQRSWGVARGDGAPDKDRRRFGKALWLDASDVVNIESGRILFQYDASDLAKHFSSTVRS